MYQYFSFTHKWVYVAAWMILLLTSCSNASDVETIDSSQPDKSLQPIVLYYNMDGKTTRASSQNVQTAALDERSKVGVHFLEEDNGSILYSNVKYDVMDNEQLQPNADNTVTPTYPDKSAVTAVAYLPFQESWTELGNHEFSVQTNQISEDDYLASDLIWGKVSGLTKTTEGTFDIPFARRLARWKINIVLDDNTRLADFRGATFAIWGVRRTTTINTATGEVPTEATGSLRVIKYCTVAADATGIDQLQGALIIPPQTIQEGQCYLRVTFKDGVTLYYGFSPFMFKSHKAYTSNVHLHGYGLDMTATIEPFKEEAIIDGDLISNE
jgi:hypothetical protein